MAEIRGFSGLRYLPSKMKDYNEVCCPPYDIISQEQQKKLYEKSSYNVVRLELNAQKDPYAGAKLELGKMLQEGVLQQDEKECLYIYEEEFEALGTRSKIKGLITLVKIEEFSKEIVLPHEETISKAKTDRFNLMKATGCNFSQIYSLYMDQKNVIFQKINELSKGKAEIEFSGEDGVIHRLWQISNAEEIAFLQGEFKELQLFIADGHHRYETALNYRNFLKEEGIITEDSHLGNYVMMFLANMENEGLVVFPTHRMLHSLENFNKEDILEKISKEFLVEEKGNLETMEQVLREKIEQKVFGLYFGGETYYLLTLKDKDGVSKKLPHMSKAYCGLDVSTLHTLILEDVFGIDKENMAKQTNLTYTREWQEAISSVRSGEYQCSFLINATRVEEIKEVSLAHEKMPQKSTYFYPKMITGLVMNKIL